MCSSGRLKQNETFVQQYAREAREEKYAEAGVSPNAPWIVHPTSWPYTLHDTDESPFNLNHGYMWGRISGFSEL